VLWAIENQPHPPVEPIVADRFSQAQGTDAEGADGEEIGFAQSGIHLLQMRGCGILPGRLSGALAALEKPGEAVQGMVVQFLSRKQQQASQNVIVFLCRQERDIRLI
jgi:hypothetical protein